MERPTAVKIRQLAIERQVARYDPLPGSPAWRGVKKSGFPKIFGNFVPNFRDWIANCKNHKPKIERKTSMKLILLGTSPNHMKQRLSKVATALLLTSCF